MLTYTLCKNYGVSFFNQNQPLVFLNIQGIWLQFSVVNSSSEEYTLNTVSKIKDRPQKAPTQNKNHALS